MMRVSCSAPAMCEPPSIAASASAPVNDVKPETSANITPASRFCISGFCSDVSVRIAAESHSQKGVYAAISSSMLLVYSARRLPDRGVPASDLGVALPLLGELSCADPGASALHAAMAPWSCASHDGPACAPVSTGRLPACSLGVGVNETVLSARVVAGWHSSCAAPPCAGRGELVRSERHAAPHESE